jgi:hypothetical protein
MSPRELFRLAGGASTPPAAWNYWVIENRLLAGAYPGSPEPEERQQKARALVHAGIRAFVDLMEPDETNLEGQPFVPYAGTVRALCPEAAFVRHSIKDNSIPSPEVMKEILDAIDEYLVAGSAVYVHCWGGVGRTGTVIGCWMLRHGLAAPNDVLDVLARLRRKDRERGGRRSPENYRQEQFVLGWPPGR